MLIITRDSTKISDRVALTEQQKEISPIVDVTEHEVYPLEFANCHRTKPHFDTNGDITEIVTTETEAETEERTTHEQHK